MLLLFVLIVAPSTNGDAKPEITDQDQQLQEGKLMYLFWLKKYPDLPCKLLWSSHFFLQFILIFIIQCFP